MEIQSYNVSYLPYVAENLGIMFEHAADIGINPIIFWNTFINSNIAKQIEKGNPKYLTCSALDYLNEMYKNKQVIPEAQDINKDKYYWAGWAIAYLQHKTGYSFYKINNDFSIEEVLNLYPTLHEADITKFLDIGSNQLKNKNEITNLKKIRMLRGLSQSALSKMANVELRSIQMYEQRHNNINKAQAETLHKLSKALSCNIEDLLEN